MPTELFQTSESSPKIFSAFNTSSLILHPFQVTQVRNLNLIVGGILRHHEPAPIGLTKKFHLSAPIRVALPLQQQADIGMKVNSP